MTDYMRVNYDAQNTVGLDSLLKNARVQIVTGDLAQTTVQAIFFDDPVITHLHASSVHTRWSRDDEHSSDRYLFCFTKEGNLTVTGTATRLSSEGGALTLVLPGQEAVDFRVTGPSDILMFSFSPREIESAVLTPASVGALNEASALIIAIRAYLETIVQTPSDSAGEPLPSLRALTQSFARALARAVTQQGQPASTENAEACLC